MAEKKKIRFGGMRIFPNEDLVRVLGVKERRIGNEIIAVPDLRLMKQFENEGLDPAQMTKQVWIYIKGNKLLFAKVKKPEIKERDEFPSARKRAAKITMPIERKSRGPKGKTKKPRARSRKDIWE